MEPIQKFSSLPAIMLIVASALLGHAKKVAASPIAAQAPGIGSGLDVNAVVSDLMQAKIAPTKASLDADLQPLVQPNHVSSSPNSQRRRIR